MNERGMNSNVSLFDLNALDYDAWFDRHPWVYRSELEAVQQLLPEFGRGVEIGVGTGRFALPLGIKVGVEPAKGMADLAEKRGLEIHRAYAERLPFPDASFDYALMVTLLCFLTDPLVALSEVRRILKPGGRLIVAFIDRESRLGQETLSSGSKYFRDIFLYSCRDMMELLTNAGFKLLDSRQTLFEDPKKMTAPIIPKTGFGHGDFVVFSAIKAETLTKGTRS